jgi:hypothetical protein
LVNDTKKAGNLHALQLVLPFLFHFTIAGANGAYGRRVGTVMGTHRLAQRQARQAQSKREKQIRD